MTCVTPVFYSCPQALTSPKVSHANSPLAGLESRVVFLEKASLLEKLGKMVEYFASCSCIRVILFFAHFVAGAVYEANE